MIKTLQGWWINYAKGNTNFTKDKVNPLTVSSFFFFFFLSFRLFIIHNSENWQSIVFCFLLTLSIHNWKTGRQIVAFFLNKTSFAFWEITICQIIPLYSTSTQLATIRLADYGKWKCEKWKWRTQRLFSFSKGSWQNKLRTTGLTHMCIRISLSEKREVGALWGDNLWVSLHSLTHTCGLILKGVNNGCLPRIPHLVGEWKGEKCWMGWKQTYDMGHDPWLWWVHTHKSSAHLSSNIPRCQECTCEWRNEPGWRSCGIWKTAGCQEKVPLLRV